MRTDTDIAYRSGLLCHSLVSLDLNIFTVVLVTISVLSLFQLSNTLVEKKLRRGPEVCCTWNLYGWPRVCVARDGLNSPLNSFGYWTLNKYYYYCIAYWTCTTNADSVKSMCYFEQLNNISSFPPVL